MSLCSQCAPEFSSVPGMPFLLPVRSRVPERSPGSPNKSPYPSRLLAALVLSSSPRSSINTRLHGGLNMSSLDSYSACPCSLFATCPPPRSSLGECSLSAVRSTPPSSGCHVSPSMPCWFLWQSYLLFVPWHCTQFVDIHLGILGSHNYCSKEKEEPKGRI